MNAFNIRFVACLAAPLFFVFWLGVFMGTLVDRADPFWPHYLVFFGAASLFSFLFLLLRKLKPGTEIFGLYLGSSLAAVVFLNLLGMYRTGDRSVYLCLMFCASFTAPLSACTSPPSHRSGSPPFWACFSGFPARVLNNAIVLAAITILSSLRP